MSTFGPPANCPGRCRPRPATALDRQAEAYLDAMAELTPIEATFRGLTEHADRLTDYSPAGHEARAQLARATLAALPGLTPLDDVDEVTLEVLQERLGHVLDLHEAGLDQADLNNVASPVQTVREVFDVAATETVQDWEAVAARLHAVQASLLGYRKSLREAARCGWSPPARQVLAGAHQAGRFSARDGFFARLAARAWVGDPVPLPEPLLAALTEAAGEAAGAYADLGRWLREELLPGARTDDAVGPEVYAIAARGFLGSEVDLTEAYRWAIAELARIESRMARVAHRIVPDATATGRGLIDAAVQTLDADPARTIEGCGAFRHWIQDLSDQAVTGLSGDHFDIPVPMRRLTCRIAPSCAGGVYYTSPSEDFSRPGQMWWSVPSGVTSFSTWRETSTVYHEGVPGHHLQIGRTIHLAGRLNRWRRTGVWVSGHSEGWALYAERLMEQLGYLDDPGDLLGMLDAHALRACRVIVDIGVHLRLPVLPEVGEGTWDAPAAGRFLRAHTRLPEPTLRFELERYLGWPGQAISYKLGERVWLGLRTELARRQGAAFSLRRFHSRALDLGPVGLEVLARHLLAA